MHPVQMEAFPEVFQSRFVTNSIGFVFSLEDSRIFHDPLGNRRIGLRSG